MDEIGWKNPKYEMPRIGQMIVVVDMIFPRIEHFLLEYDGDISFRTTHRWTPLPAFPPEWYRSILGLLPSGQSPEIIHNLLDEEG